MANRPKLKRKGSAKATTTGVDFERNEKVRAILEKNSWKLGAQDRRIFAIFGVETEEEAAVNDETLSRYLRHLKETVQFPCKVTGMQDFPWEEYYVFGPGSAKEYEKLKKNQPSFSDTFEILQFEDEFDGLEGIIVQVRRTSDKKVFYLPLSDLENVDHKSRNYELIDDYASWFTNYRT
jgi:hypothetical protein